MFGAMSRLAPESQNYKPCRNCLKRLPTYFGKVSRDTCSDACAEAVRRQQERDDFWGYAS